MRRGTTAAPADAGRRRAPARGEAVDDRVEVVIHGGGAARLQARVIAAPGPAGAGTVRGRSRVSRPKRTGGGGEPSRAQPSVCHNRDVVRLRRAAPLAAAPRRGARGERRRRRGRPAVELPRQLPERGARRVQAVTDNPSLAVKVDAEPFVARRDVFEFLLDHPEFATHVTRALKLARYRIWRTPGGLRHRRRMGHRRHLRARPRRRRPAPDVRARRLPAAHPARHPRAGGRRDRLRHPAGAAAAGA